MHKESIKMICACVRVYITVFRLSRRLGTRFVNVFNQNALRSQSTFHCSCMVIAGGFVQAREFEKFLG